MAESDKEPNESPPEMFVKIQPPREENETLCRSDDEDLSTLVSKAFTPEEYRHLNNGEQETYEVLSLTNHRRPQDAGAAILAGETLTPDSSEIDSPSSNTSTEGSVDEAPPKSKGSGPQDLGNSGYVGDNETESDTSDVQKLGDPKRKLFTNAILLCIMRYL